MAYRIGYGIKNKKKGTSKKRELYRIKVTWRFAPTLKRTDVPLTHPCLYLMVPREEVEGALLPGWGLELLTAMYLE